jgi:GNAT superfamily N-acetyltransferase
MQAFDCFMKIHENESQVTIMNFRKTTENDIARLTEIFDGARETMHARGIDQWTDGYPAESDIRADMAAGISYVLCEDDGTVAATCAVLLDGEDTYTVIEGGAWLTESSDDASASYVAVHRVATDKNSRGRGLASRLLSEAAAIGRRAGKVSLRIDTHRDNKPMQGMLARCGFQYCGEITLANGEGRIAFEKCL